MRFLASILVVMFFGASAMAAQTVLVAAPKGVPVARGTQFVETVRKEIAPLKVTKIPALKGVKIPARAKAIGAQAARKKAAYAVDAMLDAKKQLTVIAVSPRGEIVYQKTVPWPAGLPKQRTAIVGAGKDVAAALKGLALPPVAETPPPPVETAPAPAPTPPPTEEAPPPPPPPAPAENNDAFAAGATPPWMTETPPAAPAAEVETQPIHPAKAPMKRSGPFRLALGPMFGGGGYKEHIGTSRAQGDRDVKVSFAPVYGGQLELEHEVGLRLDAFVLKQSTKVTPSAVGAGDVDLSNLSIGGRLSLAVTHGEWPLAIMIGGGYEKIDAGTQSDVVWVPSNTLITTLVGLSLSHGTLASEGPTYEIGLAFLPYGKHQRTSDIVKTDSRAIGGAAWVRARYQWPMALGTSAGFFIEAAGNARYMSMSPSAVALPPDDGTVRTMSLPIGDVSSNRLDYAATASVGIMWRPGT